MFISKYKKVRLFLNKLWLPINGEININNINYIMQITYIVQTIKRKKKEKGLSRTQGIKVNVFKRI